LAVAVAFLLIEEGFDVLLDRIALDEGGLSALLVVQDHHLRPAAAALVDVGDQVAAGGGLDDDCSRCLLGVDGEFLDEEGSGGRH
jgi:hypothetical protein